MTNNCITSERRRPHFFGDETRLVYGRWTSGWYPDARDLEGYKVIDSLIVNRPVQMRLAAPRHGVGTTIKIIL